MSTKKVEKISHAEFFIPTNGGVLFDMDGTLVDSIGAVEEAWSSVADELGKDRDEVIAATHGRRAIDNLRDLKPHLSDTPDRAMDPHVQEFEERILERADSFSKEVRSRRESVASSRRASRRASRTGSRSGSTPGSRAGSQPPSRHGSFSAGSQPKSRQGSFAAELSKKMMGFQLTQLSMSASPAASPPTGTPKDVPSPRDSGVGLSENDEVFLDDDEEEEIDIDAIEVDTSDLKDNSVKILPGVRRMIGQLPEGRWCVATSGAKTYCYGALERVGIKLPEVVVTADHPELKRGKPHPDPFILAATKMGYDPKNCVVVEDSPSGIRAGVASGAVVIAVLTSHPAEKIKDCGQTYLVPTLKCVTVEPQADGRIKFIINDPPVERTTLNEA